MSKRKPVKKSFVIKYSITGTAFAYVDAESIEEAQALAQRYEIDSDEIHEWAFDDVLSVEENS